MPLIKTAIGVGQPVTRLPPTDPGVRNYRTGIFKVTRFTLNITRCCFAIPRREVGIVCSSSTSLVRVSFAGYITLLTPSPCTRLSRAPSTMSQSDSSITLQLPLISLSQLTCLITA